MSTRMSFFSRKPQLTALQFSHHWKVVHAPIALSIPGLEIYEQNIILRRYDSPDAPLAARGIDGICRLRFGDDSAMQNVMSPQMVATLKADEAEFLTDLSTVTLDSRILQDQPPKTGARKFFVFLSGDAPFDAANLGITGRISNHVTARTANRTTVSREALPIDQIEELWPAPDMTAEAFAARLQTAGLTFSLFEAELNIPKEMQA